MAAETPACSDDEAAGFLSDAFGADRLSLNEDGENAYHVAAKAGRVDVLVWLKTNGGGELCNGRDDVGGQTPLMMAIEAQQEGAARWLIANGANAAAMDNYSGTTYALAAEHMSGSPEFLDLIRPLVPADHIE